MKFYKQEKRNFLSRGEIVIGLLAMAMVSSIVFYIKSSLNSSELSFHVILMIKTITWLFWGCWIPIIFFFSEKFPIRKDNAYLGILFHLPISIIIVGIHILLYASIVKLSPIPNIQSQSIGNLFNSFFFSQFEWYFMTYWALILGSYAFNYHDKFKDSNIRSAQLEMLLAKAKLNALKMQLHPHFLFNTLNTISSLVRQNEKVNSISMLSELGDLLRHVLNQSEDQFILLSKEVDFLEKYITLEAKRFKNKMTIDFKLGKDLEEVIIPSFLLQPLIENSIHHGLSKKIDASILSIDIGKIEDRLVVKIYNDGFPLPENFHITKTNGIGLANSIERLSQLYQENYSLDIFNYENGVMTELSIPYRK